MILVTKNKATTVTGSEQSIYFTAPNSTAPTFLVGFTSHGTNETVYVASGATATSATNQPRYLSVTFKAGTTESQAGTPTYDLSGPKFPEGYYSYTIYAQAVEWNLDPAGLTTVNTGIAFFQDEDGAFSEDTYTSNPNTTNGYTYYTE
tara:strand:+ start:2559 stop:3002 length:444 start_codon:yes stop_codon:yes gene_type:complete